MSSNLQKGLSEEVPDLEIPKVVIDRAHRIGPDYTNKTCRKYVSLSLFALRRSVILQHFTELEGLQDTEHRLGQI